MGAISDGPMRNGSRQTAYLERDKRLESEKELMKYITTTNTQLGKHNVMSNQADWQFGSSRFSGHCLPLALPNQGASQMSWISRSQNGSHSNHLLINLIRTERNSKHLKIVNLFTTDRSSLRRCLHCVRWLCVGASLTLLRSSGLAVINGALTGICNPPFDSPSPDNALESHAHKSVGHAHIQEARFK